MAVLIAVPVLANGYTAHFTITETSHVAYSYLPVSGTIDNLWLVNNGFMTASTLDTRVETVAGLYSKHMPTQDKVWTVVPSVPADSQVNLYYTTANSALASFPIIDGYGGKVTKADTAAWEPGNNFDMTLTDVYLNTTTGVNKYLVYKRDAFRIYVSSTGNVSARIAGANADQITQAASTAGATITGINTRFAQTFTIGASDVDLNHIDLWLRNNGGATGTLNVAVRATAANLPTGSDLVATTMDIATIGAGGAEYAFDLPYTLTTGVQYAVIVYSLNIAVGTVDVYYSNANPYAGGTECTSADGITWASVAANDLYFKVNGNTAAVTVSKACATGEHDIRAYADAVNLGIQVDGGAVSTQALGGASVTNNANIWYLLDNSTTQFVSYCESYAHTVGGALVSTYNPVSLILGQQYNTGTVTVTNGDATVTGAGGATWTAAMEGSVFISTDGVYYTVSDVTGATTLELDAVYGGGTLAGQTYNLYPRLPDAEATADDAAIIFGANPGGITTTFGSMVSKDQPGIGATPTPTTSEVISTVAVSDWFGDGTVTKASTLANPIRPFITMVSDNTTLDEIQVWRWMGVALLLFVVVGVGKVLRGHQGITAIVTSAMLGAMIAFDSNIFPFWLLTLAVGGFIGGIIAERSPSL